MSLISRLIAIIIIVFVTINNYGMNPAIAMDNTSLPACPSSPNCVVSQGADAKHAIDPITYHVSPEKARATLLKVLGVVPRTTVIAETDNYIHAISKSRIFKFVDDVEFYFPSNENVIHVRSASRVSESDLGVNRRRVEQIRLALQDLNI